MQIKWKMINDKWQIQSGFTLIELLVVISIIGVLASLILASFTTSQRQTRDTQRKSDLKQYSASLEAFANSTGGLYPSYTSTQSLTASSNTLCTALGLTNCPSDPVSDATHVYKFVSNGSGAGGSTASTYVLWSLIESSPNYWVLCSNGKSGISPSSTWTDPAPSPVVNGVLNCPI